jgi:inner membrane protein
LCSAIILTEVITRSRSRPLSSQDKAASGTSLCQQQSCADDCADNNTSWLRSLVTRIDYRLVLVGSLLPDIIDKPIGTLLFRNFFSNGRIFSHTLLFLAILTVAAVYLYRKKGQTWLVALSFGTFIHLILDGMWLAPRTLLWPVYGWAFERVDLSHWPQDMLYALMTNPGVYIPEITGAIILIVFMIWLVYRRKVYAFVTKGEI